MSEQNELVLSGDPAPDFCATQTVVKVEGAARCVLCFQREGNPGDCQAGERFKVSFGAAGGVVICRRGLADLTDKAMKEMVTT